MPHPALIAQNRQFERQIVQLAPNIWGAIGYALSNVYMIEGKSSVTIIDTTESTAAAQQILAEFRTRCDKPVGRIIYTHGHRDHVGGASVFAGGADIPVIASGAYRPDMNDIRDPGTYPEKAMLWRPRGQFGFNLPPDERISLGCGPADRPMQGLGAGYMRPTDLVPEDSDIDLDGVAARIVLAPGETDDHLGVWLPELRLLFSADNWYHAFPNLYSIRGTLFRSYQAWADGLAKFASLDAEIMAPGHCLPVHGAEEIRDRFLSTREAILYVMTETTRLMDEGVAWDDLASHVSLPPHLAEKPWLQEFYGRLDWCVRGYAHGILGWYDGNPTHLDTLPTKTRAALMAQLAGGPERLMEAALSTDNPQWALELCDSLMALGHAPATELKAQKLAELGEAQINAIARNSYFYEAQRLREGRPLTQL